MGSRLAQFLTSSGFFEFLCKKRKTLKNCKNGEIWQKRLVFHCGAKTFVISLSMV